LVSQGMAGRHQYGDNREAAVVVRMLGWCDRFTWSELFGGCERDVVQCKHCTCVTQHSHCVSARQRPGNGVQPQRHLADVLLLFDITKLVLASEGLFRPTDL
jgi:hypothetical protein